MLKLLVVSVGGWRNLHPTKTSGLAYLFAV
jgi:hypothetical protein